MTLPLSPKRTYYRIQTIEFDTQDEPYVKTHSGYWATIDFAERNALSKSYRIVEVTEIVVKVVE